jgi:hypothetical protein
MTFFQNLWRDLVDKRLWPVAIALVLAAVAVPFLIGSGSAPPVGAASSATPPAATGASTAQIAVAARPGDKPVRRAGAARDPFKPLVFAKSAVGTAAAAGGVAASVATGTASTASGVTGVTGTAGTGGGSGAGAGAGAASGAASTPASRSTPTTTTVTKTKLVDYALSVQIKRSGKLTVRKGLRAVTYIPSPVYPLLSFLGVKSDGRTATFLVSDGVAVSGADRVCRPSRATCRLLELQAGDNVLLTRTPPSGGEAKRYRVRIVRLALTETTRAPVARTSGRAGQAATRAATARAAGAAPPLRLAPARQVTSVTATTG